MFSLITDLHALRQKVVEVGNVKMVLIDPISAYLGIGEIDSFRATDVRAVLGPLKTFAEELRTSILGILHFNKRSTSPTSCCACPTVWPTPRPRGTSTP